MLKTHTKVALGTRYGKPNFFEGNDVVGKDAHSSIWPWPWNRSCTDPRSGWGDEDYRPLDAEDNYNLLFAGPPASAKTLFLLGMTEYKKGVYFDGSNTTNRILDVLEEKRPKIICIDELDKIFLVKWIKIYIGFFRKVTSIKTGPGYSHDLFSGIG